MSTIIQSQFSPYASYLSQSNLHDIVPLLSLRLSGFLKKNTKKDLKSFTNSVLTGKKPVLDSAYEKFLSDSNLVNDFPIRSFFLNLKLWSYLFYLSDLLVFLYNESAWQSNQFKRLQRTYFLRKWDLIFNRGNCSLLSEIKELNEKICFFFEGGYLTESEITLNEEPVKAKEVNYTGIELTDGTAGNRRNQNISLVPIDVLISETKFIRKEVFNAGAYEKYLLEIIDGKDKSSHFIDWKKNEDNVDPALILPSKKNLRSKIQNQPVKLYLLRVIVQREIFKSILDEIESMEFCSSKHFIKIFCFERSGALKFNDNERIVWDEELRYLHFFLHFLVERQIIDQYSKGRINQIIQVAFKDTNGQHDVKPNTLSKSSRRLRDINEADKDSLNSEKLKALHIRFILEDCVNNVLKKFPNHPLSQ